jgi:hypothetical protein
MPRAVHHVTAQNKEDCLLRNITLFLLVSTYAYGQETSQDLETYGPWKGRWVKARLSAYSPQDRIDAVYRASKGERWKWITADGRTDVRRTPHGIAAISSVPFGTRIFIPAGYGFLDATLPSPNQRVLRVDDRGSRLDGAGPGEIQLRLDLRYRTEYSALAFGIKEAWVFVITEGK